MKLFVAVFLIFISIVSGTEQSASSEPYEKQLVDRLFKNYNPMVRPVEDQSKPLNISIRMFLESLKEVNDKEATITISGWLTLTWNDYYLSWNPSEYGNVSFFLHRAENIWRPDLAFSSAIGDRMFRVDDAFISVNHKGGIEFAPGGVSTHSCELDMRLFPFDTQTCRFVVGTWFSTARSVQLVPLGIRSLTKVSNEIWDMIDNQTEIISNGEDAAMLIAFSLTVRRKPLYYIVNVIIPLLVLSFLNIMVFRVSPKSGEKISLSITILLAFAIWMTMLNDLTPRSSDLIPILGTFITALMLLSAVSTTVSVYIVRIYNFDENYAIPSWVERIVRFSPFKRSRVTRHEKNELHSNPTLSWQAVALALDQFAFIVVSLITAGLIISCVVGFILQPPLERNLQ